MYFEENKVESGLTRRSLHGGAVSIVARGLNAFIQIGSVLFLARLLSPEDYGLVSMVAALTGFAPSLVDLGTRDAIVQRQRITEREISALFWITVAIGSVFTVLIIACGPLIAKFYREPRLTMIAAVSSITFVASALQCQHYALLRRTMKFVEIGAIEVTSNLLSAAIAVGMAFMGFHYWALVLRPVLLCSFITVGVWVRCRWLPSLPDFSKGVKEMIRFGLHTAGFTLADFGSKSSDRIAIGYKNGARSLGFYQNATFIYDNLLDVLVLPLHNVAVASLSKVRGDLKELKRLWAKALSTLSFYAMPGFGLLAVTSQDIVVLLLGAKWASAGVLLSVLAMRGIPHTVERTLGWLHVPAGRSDRWMRWGILTMIVHFCAMLLGLPYGPHGVVIAFLITTSVLFIPAIAYAGRPLQIGAGDVVRVIWRQVAASLIAAAIGFTLRFTVLASLSKIARTAILAPTYIGVYLLIVVGVFQLREPVAVIITLVKDALPARFARLVKVPGLIATR